jgi:hypothetical protein
MLGNRIVQALSLGLVFASSTFASLGGVAESVHQLNEDNFEEKVSKGLWLVSWRVIKPVAIAPCLTSYVHLRLVEHFSPGCQYLSWSWCTPVDLCNPSFRRTLQSFRTDI